MAAEKAEAVVEEASSLSEPVEEYDEAVLHSLLRLANLQINPILTAAILESYSYAPQALFEASDEELSDIPNLSLRHLNRIRDEQFLPSISQLRWLEEQDHTILWIGHPDYPAALKEIYDPPAMLFIRGYMLEQDRFGIGIVGSRQATPYGRSVAERMARELSGYKLTLVSGGALGIDAAVHLGAIEGNGRTVAVLGCGVDVDYPRGHRSLYTRISSHGALISEYAPGTAPEPWRFPARNRIISGMTQGLLVVEAPQSSGALITARFAVDQGRTVMAIPGNIDRPASVGTNQLIKDGALAITESADILQALGMVALPAVQAELDFDEIGISEFMPNSGVSKEQKSLLALLSLTPIHLDAIAKNSGLSVNHVGTELTLLELAGLVRRLPGNTYIRLL